MCDLKVKVDCIIIGGGITGLATSLKLADIGLSCVVIDKSNLQEIKVGETLSSYCYKFFKELGIDFSTKLCCKEYLSKKVKWNGEYVNMDVTHVAPFSYTVDRRKFEIELSIASSAIGNTVLLKTKIFSISQIKEGWNVQLVNAKGRHTVQAKLLVNASGRGYLKLVPESKRIYIDKLIAYSTIRPVFGKIPAGQLYIEAVRDGWLYSNILPHNRQVFTGFTDSDLVESKAQRRKVFEYLWNKSTDNILANLAVEEQNTVNLFDARTYWTTVQSGKGWLSLGEAAYSIDPLSGLGIEKNLHMINFFLLRIQGFLKHDIEAAKEYALFNKLQFDKYNKQRRLEYAKARQENGIFWKRREQ